MFARTRIALAAAVAALSLAVTVAPALATFPGTNGKISFNRFLETEDEQAVSDLFSVNPDGSDLLQLTNFGFDTFSEFSDHSPDGRTLAFQRFDFESEESNPPTQVWLTDADGTNARQLTDFADTDAYEGAFDPAFSPDGRTLAIDAVADGVPGIFLIPARAPKGKLLTEADAVRVTSAPDDTAFDSEPQFSPDGRWIVFTRFSIECATGEGDCLTRIYKVRANGRDLKQLTSVELNASAPDWHPSGLVITFDSHDSFFAPNVGHIMVMLADGSFKRVIVRGDADSHFGNPSFSPNGTRIAFTDFALGPDGNPTEPLRSSIWTAWVTGHHRKQITSGAADNKADWGPAIRRHHRQDDDD
jgi:Tol biopolymer transport system component